MNLIRERVDCRSNECKFSKQKNYYRVETFQWCMHCLSKCNHEHQTYPAYFLCTYTPGVIIHIFDVSWVGHSSSFPFSCFCMVYHLYPSPRMPFTEVTNFSSLKNTAKMPLFKWNSPGSLQISAVVCAFSWLYTCFCTSTPCGLTWLLVLLIQRDSVWKEAWGGEVETLGLELNLNHQKFSCPTLIPS